MMPAWLGSAGAFTTDQAQSKPSMVKVLPEEVCPQTRMEALKPSIRFQTILDILHRLQSQAWLMAGSRTWSKMYFFDLYDSVTCTLSVRNLIIEFRAPRLDYSQLKGLPRTTTLILVFIKYYFFESQLHTCGLTQARIQTLFKFFQKAQTSCEQPDGHFRSFLSIADYFAVMSFLFLCFRSLSISILGLYPSPNSLSV